MFIRRGGFALLVVLALAAGLAACSRQRPPTSTTTTTTRTSPTTVDPGPGSGAAPVSQKTIRYGPYRVPGATASDMGMLENNIAGNVARPCSNCLITGMQAGLELANGTKVNVGQGYWLHHMVMFDSAKQDLTCPGKGPGLLGQRFFSSGNERTPVRSEGPFGYPQGANDRWNLIYDLANLTATAQDLYITVTYDYVAPSSGYRPMTPIWFDIDQCGVSEKPAKTGPYSYDYSVTSKWAGKLIGIGGHLHDGGTHVELGKNGQVYCDSVAKYGETSAYVESNTSRHMPGMPHISTMTRCQGTAARPVTTIKAGDTLTLKAYYDTNAHMPMGTHPVMGIAIGYFDLG